MKIQLLDKEVWWGGRAEDGAAMPLTAKSRFFNDFAKGDADQSSPLYLSSAGRYIHSDKPFSFSIDGGVIDVNGESEIELGEGYGNLRGAYMAAAEKFFIHDAPAPEKEFFTSPQFNTWIELMYDQNQVQILEYARSIVASGITPGILMIDEGWAEDYGVYDFYPGRFADPKAMLDELHALGFKVMLWVTPYISPDSNTYRQLRGTDLLLKDENGKIAIREWWNGFSCSLDLTNPEACAWLKAKLDGIMEKYGVDGFKFDAGDANFYRNSDKAFVPQFAQDYTTSFNKFAEGYSYNELRAVWNMSGSSLICRLHDKFHSWTENGLNTIVPNTLTQGLLGYHFGCPDMIGGGDYGSFLESGFAFDTKMYIRWMEASLLMPMIQFSVAPWRVLSADEFKVILDLLEVRKQYLPYILELAKESRVTREPIVRPLDYQFPNSGYAENANAFMLGSKYLVVPCIEKGACSVEITLPEGVWKYPDGKLYQGGEHAVIDCPLEVLPIFEKVQ